MSPLRCRVVDKFPGFSKEMIHIRDNCFMFREDKFIEIVLEHDNSLECHGFSRNALPNYSLKSILEQPVLHAMDESIVDIVMNTVESQTIKESKCCNDLRTACKYWNGTSYIYKLYDGRYSSIYSFVYDIRRGNPIVCLQIVNYGKRDMTGSFSIDLDIIEKIYNILKESRK